MVGRPHRFSKISGLIFSYSVFVNFLSNKVLSFGMSGLLKQSTLASVQFIPPQWGQLRGTVNVAVSHVLEKTTFYIIKNWSK